VLSHFFITILLSHSLLIQCSVIPRCYSVQLFFIATAFNHSLYYSTQPFSIATVLSHFHYKRSSIIPHATVLNHSSLLQCSVVPRHYSAQSFLVTTVCMPLSHFVKWLSKGVGVRGRRRLGQGGAWRGGDSGLGWGCAGVSGSVRVVGWARGCLISWLDHWI
jgi:hypothetical protein